MDNRRHIFSTRLNAMCDKHPSCPAHGRGTWLLNELKARGISVSGQCISNWMNGNTVPRDEKLKQMAAIFEVAAAWLGGFDYEEQPHRTLADKKSTNVCYSIPISLGDNRKIEVNGIPQDLSEAEARRVANIILALAA